MFKFLFYIGLPVILIVSIATSKAVDSPDALMESHLWELPVVIVASGENDAAALADQRRAIDTMNRDDVVIYEVVNRTYVKRNGEMLPHVSSAAFLEHFSIPDNAFSLVLFRLDGEEDHRHTSPVTAEALSGMIDRLYDKQYTQKESPVFTGKTGLSH